MFNMALGRLLLNVQFQNGARKMSHIDLVKNKFSLYINYWGTLCIISYSMDSFYS
jgi:hypothetical protein